jgi:hypothetical protein
MAIDVEKLLTITKAMYKASEAMEMLLCDDVKEEVRLTKDNLFIRLNGVDILNRYLTDICRNILKENFTLELFDVFLEALKILQDELKQVLSPGTIFMVSDFRFFIDGKEVDIN